jgi:alpha-amylase
MPFLRTLARYPEIKANIHFSGCLLEWMSERRKEIMDLIGELAAGGRIELLGGGFYEPVLPSIPPQDRFTQIKMLSSFIEKRFGQNPRGAWIAERVWEPTLPSDLNKAGIDFAVLDDTHFIYSGIPEKELTGYYVAEDMGRTVNVFPSSRGLRYQIPYKPPEECMEYIRMRAEGCPGALFVYADDGEKFGEWPGTYEWIYDKGWLKGFFENLRDSSAWLKTVKFSEVTRIKRSSGKVYLPTSSYEEMLQWSLPADRQEHLEDVLADVSGKGLKDFYEPFLRGGFWRNFFSIYPESNMMNKKMLYLSKRLERSGVEKERSEGEPGDIRKGILRAQCNCAYWHGVFGGLYLYHLRREVYSNLIEAERMLDKAEYGDKSFLVSEETDIDSDGEKEILIGNREVSLCFKPGSGGQLIGFDLKGAGCNLLNSLSRRKEAYHRKILARIRGNDKNAADSHMQLDDGINEEIYYDWYNRYSLVDHFMAPGTEIGQFSQCRYEEKGDLVNQPYEYRLEEGSRKRTLSMWRDGKVGGVALKICKTITVRKEDRGFSAEYLILNKGDSVLEAEFGVECNLTLPYADSERYFIRTDNGEKTAGFREKAVFEPAGRIYAGPHNGGPLYVMEFAEGIPGFWCFPVMTVSQSERAYELNYQSSVIMPVTHLELSPGDKRVVRFRVKAVTEDGADGKI